MLTLWNVCLTEWQGSNWWNFGIICLTLQYHKKKDLLAKPFQPFFTNELCNVDMNKCSKACDLLPEQFPTVLSWESVLFTDKWANYCSTSNQNVVFWAEKNLHFTLEVANNPAHDMFWAGGYHKSFHCIILFWRACYWNNIPGNVLELAKTKFTDEGIMEQAWFQHNGALAHFVLTVHDFLNDNNFPGRWTG